LFFAFNGTVVPKQTIMSAVQHTIRILIPSPLRKFTGGESRIDLQADTVASAFQRLTALFPELAPHVLDEAGKLREFLRVYLGDEDIQALQGPQTALQQGDTVSIVPAIAGGSAASGIAAAAAEVPADSLPTFSRQELERYSRHLIIPEFNIQGQRKLKAAKVLVVGTGGLGAPLLQYLAAAGVGTLGILDFDVVEDHNLQRQVLFSTADVGRPKVEAAADRIRGLNPYIEVRVHQVQLTRHNALEILADYDVIADGTDNFPTRYLVNDACVLLGKVNVYASIFRFEGQLSVFNYRFADGTRGPNYRDLFPTPPPPGLVPSCAEGGVIGVLPGILGSLQANEVIKVISGVGEPLVGRLMLLDAASMETRTLKLRANPENPLSGPSPRQTALIDYEQFCGINPTKPRTHTTRSITVQTLQEWLSGSEPPVVIDVREPYEYEIAHLNGTLIPKATVEDRLDAIPAEGRVVVHCRSGVRSADVINLLESKYGFGNLYNLEGGILAWAREIDPGMATY